MKESKHYKLAMFAVIDSQRIPTEEKLEVLETLMADKRIAEYAEEAEEQEAEKDAALS